LSYRVPEHLRTQVRPGTVVVAPLSGRPRLGVVVGTGEETGRAREDLISVTADLSLPPGLVEACRRICENAAVPLPLALRAALPTGLDVGRYRVLHAPPSWPWQTNNTVTRAALKRVLGDDGLREAEADGRIELFPAAPGPPVVEWAVVRSAADPDLARAPRQRELFTLLNERGGASPVSTLLAETGANRPTLRELVRRGAVRLVRRAQAPPTVSTEGDHLAVRGTVPFLRAARRAVEVGGASLWRMPTREMPDAVAAVVRATLEAGGQSLVLAPEIDTVESLVYRLRSSLPAGYTMAPYHSGLGRGRTAVYGAAREGDVDVVVGTRTAALLPLRRPGSICVVDEPAEAHRAEPGYEGLPLHAREVALERSRAEGAAAFFFSPFPSLRIFAPEVRKRERIRELPPRRPAAWPGVRLVDMRGSGATLSTTLIEACRRRLEEGGRVGVVANRLGYATAVACARCGAVKRCPNCDLPLSLRGRSGPLFCPRCGHREAKVGRCDECGSGRVRPTGLAVEHVREALSEALAEPVGLVTAGERDRAGAPVVVGTAHCVFEDEWDAVVLPDVDGFLLGSAIGAVERSFRLLYAAAERARDLLLLQTRVPEHYALRAGVRGDYESFAAAELPRLRSLGYPPFGHLCSLTFEGPEEAVRRAVESRLRPALERGVEMSAVVPLGRAGGRPEWRILLRSPELKPVARAATLAGRLAAGSHGLKARVEVDPEEV
jgi:primosomal protein N' (replication factor Y)